MAKDEYVPFTGKLDAAPQFEPFDGTLDGEKPKRTWGEAIKDTGAHLAEGVNTTLGAIPSVVAPQSRVAGFFRDNAQYWNDQQSDVLKDRIAASDQRIQEAGKDGVLSQIGTAASEYWNDPTQAARLVATNLPSMAATLGTGAAAGLAAKGVAAARGLDAASKAALAAKYGTTTAAATNAALNAGGARGEAFDDLQKAALAKGMTPEQAEQAGVTGSILPGVVGGAAGAISGKIGLEKAILGQATTGAAMRKAAGAFGAELAGEQIEELAPKVATNYQVWQIDATRGLTDGLGRTMVETAIGSGPGAVVAGGAAGMGGGDAPTSTPPAQDEFTTSPGAADPNAPSGAQATPPEAPDLTTSPGAGVARDGMDFTRDVDTSGLSLQDPAELERQRAAAVDYQPGDTTPQWDTQPGAAAPRTGLDMPAPEFDTGSLGIDNRTPSERMGLDPAKGSLTSAAALAVDTGASPVQFLGAAGRDLVPRRTGPGVTDDSNVIDVQGRVVEDRAIGTPRRLTAQESAYESGAQAFRDGAPRAEIVATQNVVARAHQLRGYDDAARQASTPALPAPSNLREGLERIRAQRQEAARAQAAQTPVADATTTVPATRAAALEAPGPAAATPGVDLGPQTTEAQPRGAQPAPAGRAQAAAPAPGTGTPAAVGASTAGALTDGAPAQNLGAQAAPAAGPQTQAPQGPVARPDGWRKTMLRAAPIARSMGIDPTGKRLAQVLAEIDARDTLAPAPPAPQPAPGPVRIGRNNTPLTEGGKPFKTRKAAGDAKKLQPMMRVVTVPGGYALAEKTPAQLAAEERASRRLRNPNTSAPGEPIPAHAFIAAAGGLSRAVAADMGVDGNPRIGNRTLFAGQGRGLSMEQATQILIQDGYLSEGASINDALSLIKTSLTRPQYDADGIERIAEAEVQARFEDYLAAQEEAAAEGDADPFGMADSFTAEELDEVGYTDADPALQAEVAALIAQAEAIGIDTYAILEDIARTYANATQDQYNAAARDALAQAIARSNQDGSSTAAQAAPASESAADQGLDPTPALELESLAPAEAAAQQAAQEQAAKAETARQRAADAQAARDDERKRIAQASVRAADSFELGQDPLDSLTGQGSIFDDAPAQSAPTAASDDEGRERFTLSIEMFGDVPYRASKPVDAGSGTVVSSRVITAKTKLTAANAERLGLPKDKGTVYAWRVSVIRRANGETYAVIEAMATDNGRSPDGEVLAHFKEVENPEAMERIAPAIVKAAMADWQAAQSQQAPAATEPVAQPITRADVEDAQQQAATLIGERIDAMTAGEVNTIARRFLPTMGVKPTASKERNKVAVTDFTKVNPIAAADEFGVTLPADVRRALEAEFEGRVADGSVEPAAEKPAAAKPAAAPQPEAPAAPIEDAGEKIGGARKDRWKERGLNLDDLDAMTESEGAELATKANVWKPDYEALAAQSEPVTAAMVKTIYDQLAAKPKKNTPEGRRQYVQMMRIVRDVLTEAKGPEAVRNAYLEIRKRAGLNAADPAAKAAGRELLFSVYKGRSDPFVLGYTEMSKAKKLVEDGFPAKGEPWKTRLSVGRAEGGAGTTERGIEIYMERSAEVGTPLTREQILDGFYRVSTKDNKTVAFAASKADAEAAAATVYERDMKGKKDGKPEPVRPNLDELKRENLPKRIDRDVTSEDFVRDLGFRGVEFGNWSAQDERQRILNMAYDGLMDLAEIMGVPPKAMSLNGTLGMAFGARGGGRFAAHYEPGKLVINMTKIRGGGSMAHEWAHAMDHYFGELDKPDAYTTQARGASGWYSEDQYNGVPRRRMERVGNEWKNVEKRRLDNLRPEMAAAFDEVMRALFKKQITKAEMVRSHELDLERTEALAAKEQDADMKAMYTNMAENKRQALDELRQDPEDRMYDGRGRSDYASQAQELSGKSENGYWTRPTEMFARAFESWVFDKVTAMGARSDYLVHGVEEDRFAGGGYRGNPYPTGEERARINAAFDKLTKTIKTKETDTGNVAMFSRASGSVPQTVAKWLPDTVIADEVEKRIGGFAQQPPIRIRDTAFGQLPGVARNDNVAGAVHDGAIYLFRDQLGDRAAVQRTLFHELFHFGLRKFLTKEQFTGQMMNLYRRDRAIKEEADRWAATADGLRAKEFGGSEYALARGVDEALAILAEPNGGPHLNQTARAMFVRRVTNWLADVAQFLKMDKAAAYLRSLHNSEARAYIQSVFKRLETDAGGNTLNWSEPSEPAFSRTASPSQPAAWDAPTPTGFDDVIYKLQDKNIDLKRVVEAITKSVGQVSDSINAYLKEELFHKRAAKRVADFGARELKPLMNQMRLAGLSMEDVEEYLHARHAKEANAVIAQRNPGNAGLQDGGSGMTNAAADNYFAKLDPAQRRKLESVAAKVDAIIADTRKLYVDYGLEDQAVVDGWANMYQHYIPLMREDKDGGMGTGQGFSVKGRETKGRTGSTRKVVDILANIASQREKLIVRGEKNRVTQALVGLAQANPNSEFWEVRSQAPTERVFDPKTGVVVERPDPLFKSRDNVVVAKVKDAKGNVTEQMVVFNEDNPRAVRMAAAMKNLDAGNLEGLLGVSAKITRYFAAINTQYNPVFGVVNLVRDVQGAMVNLAATPLAGQQGKIAKDTMSALRGIYGDIRKTRRGGQATSQWSQLWEQMQDDGGTTGYRELFTTSADRANNLKSILNPESWMDNKWGKVFTANGKLRVPMSIAQKGATEIFGWLSDYNEAMENGVRLAAYKAALDKGMSREQAASIAKNLTVNFNRKGQVGQQAGAVYAFFNAAMQGTARIGQTLFDMDGGDISTLRLSKTGKAVVYGGITLGAIQALALAAAGFDAEDPPEFVRERSLVIPTGGKTYVTIPMPLGLHVIPGIGRHAVEFALSGFDKPAQRAVAVAGMFADAFNPIGNAGLSMQTIAPTALDPIAALTENKDWTGKPIARVSSNKALPGHTQWKDTATGFSKVVAEAINWVSGGNEYVAGAFSPTPDQIDYLIAQLGGGVAREAAKVQQTVSSTLSGEELPTHKIPLVGRFVGNAASQASQGSAFYANLNKLNELETEIKGLRKDGKFEEASQLIRQNPQAIMIPMANRAERDVQKLRREKRELIAKDASREEVRAKEEQITAVMARLNEAAARRKATAPE